MKRVCLFLILLSAAFSGFAQQQDPRAKEVEKDVALGKDYVKEIEKQLKLSEDKDAIAKVQKIGAELAKIQNDNDFGAIFGDKNHHIFEYVFKVVADKDVNAFSIPGGFIYVNEGLLTFSESDDELAAVIAHEITHAANRHMATLIKERSKVDVWTIPIAIAALLGGSPEGAITALNTGDLVKTALTSGWSQNAERDADQGGFFVMSKSSFSPVAMLTFLERLEYRDRNSPNIDWGINRTHPPSSERVQNLRKLLLSNGYLIERSKVTKTWRAIATNVEGGISVKLGGRELFQLKGEQAELRANQAIEKINRFFDSSPQLFAVRQSGPKVIGKFDILIEFSQEDGNPDFLAAAAVAKIKDAIFSLSIRTSG